MIIEALLAELSTDDPAAIELAGVIGNMLTRNKGIQDALHRVQQTWLLAETPVTLDAGGAGLDPTGDAYFDRINLASGFTASVNASEPRQIDITGSPGAGADCMFDYLVSSCFATLSGFTEGEVFTSVSGCTFIGYSTVQGAATAISALGQQENPVLYICSGLYLENVTFTGPSNNTVHIVGAGRIATQITGQTSGGTTLKNTTNTTVTFTLENIGINVHNSPAAIGIGDDGGGSNWLCRNVKVATSSNATSIGVYTGPVATGTDWRFEMCFFTGSGIGFADSGPDRTDILWGSVVLVNCEVRTATGALFANDGRFRAVGTQFTCSTAAIKNDQAFTSIGIDLESCRFDNCTDVILATVGGGFNRLGIVGCTFNNNTTSINTGSTANVWTTCIIVGNQFITNTGTNKGIDDTNGCFSRSVIVGNAFRGYNANNELIGLDTSDNQIAHNTTDSGGTLPDTHSSAGGAPTTASYVTLSLDAGLTAERVLTAGAGITITDNGPNSTVVVAASNANVIKQMYISLGSAPVPYSI